MKPGQDPTGEDLRNFIQQSVYQKFTGFNSEIFLRQYFELMLRKGKILLLLDSFDEIPGILDAEESRVFENNSL